MTVSLYDIAKATGFFTATVSLFSPTATTLCAPPLETRYWEVAQNLGYRPNLSARSLRTDRTETIGIVVDDIMSPFVPPIVRGILDCLADRSLSSLIVNSDWDPGVNTPPSIAC